MRRQQQCAAGPRMAHTTPGSANTERGREAHGPAPPRAAVPRRHRSGVAAQQVVERGRVQFDAGEVRDERRRGARPRSLRRGCRRARTCRGSVRPGRAAARPSATVDRLEHVDELHVLERELRPAQVQQHPVVVTPDDRLRGPAARQPDGRGERWNAPRPARLKHRGAAARARSGDAPCRCPPRR
jgi:hypothetical protein